jgi:membrane protein DedA with SNARE-associated domain
MTQLPDNLPGIIKAIEPFVTSYGYLGIGALLFVDNIGIPVKGQTALIVGGLFAAVGTLNIFVTILVATIACIAGASIAYGIGKFIRKKSMQSYAKRVLVMGNKFEKVDTFFEKEGHKLVLVARFVAILRQLNGLIAGAGQMKWAEFTKFNSLGALIWVMVWVAVGYSAESFMNVFLGLGFFVSWLGLIIILYLVGRNYLPVFASRFSKKKVTVTAKHPPGQDPGKLIHPKGHEFQGAISKSLKS